MSKACPSVRVASGSNACRDLNEPLNGRHGDTPLLACAVEVLCVHSAARDRAWGIAVIDEGTAAARLAVRLARPQYRDR